MIRDSREINQSVNGVRLTTGESKRRTICHFYVINRIGHKDHYTPLLQRPSQPQHAPLVLSPLSSNTNSSCQLKAVEGQVSVFFRAFDTLAKMTFSLNIDHRNFQMSSGLIPTVNDLS